MAERKLHVASDLKLPVEAITQTFIIFGKRGSGKSNTGVVLAEEMHRAGAPIIVLDPISAWWGLKASVDGQGVGLPVYVFGGPHQDLPLQPTAGELMARVAIEHRIPMVLDMKGWSGGERARFVTAFAEHLLDHNDRTPVHVFIEEADAFIPQRPYKGEERMLGAMDRLIRWGRQEGIGATAISQRSAKINKDVTTQAETLIAHRTTGPQDRDAIDAWIKYHAGGEQREQILATLATLPDGTAWVWSPEWLEILRQVHFRRRATFDSASTPKLGEKRVEPKALAQVDVDRLAEQLAATVQQAKVEDPKALQARIRELERQVAAQPAPAPEPEKVVERIEVPVLNGQVERLEAVVGDLRQIGQGMVVAGTGLAGVADSITAAIARVGSGAQAGPAVATLPRPQSRPAPSRAVAAVSTPPTSDGALGKGERTILIAVAQYPAGAARDQLSVLTGYKRSSRDTYLQRLSSAGYVQTSGGQVRVTEAGIAALGSDYEPLPQGGALQDYWRARLPEGERRVFEVLVAAYPGDVQRDQIDEATGYKRSSRDTYLQRLRSRRLVENVGPSEVRASEDLF
jgi:hypothetical protein